ncbi:MAG TPA: VIT and VWA domain-containing protein [Blastocatellia bacterium]|nr:VIT and VWA domain-containing protein [Blastocatellia bacterium]
MQRRIILSVTLLTMLGVASYIALARVSTSRGLGFAAAASTSHTQGALQVVDPEKGVVALCPLKHTDVKAEISGFISRVVVTQEFENPFKEKIEAVYTFPLPHNAAVDDMTMRVGDRTVRGRIRRREEARAVYEAARASGNVASLLDQERPNIFTQSVANIMPGEKVNITISYVETLRYEDGSYEFVFPMVVGPRYIPGAPIGKQGGGWAPDTDRVPDASRITPPVAREGTRAGHDISIAVALDAGVPIDGLKSPLHDVEVERPSAHSAVVELKDKAVIPNKDFILKYDVAGQHIEDAVLTHRSGRADPGDGFFTMILQPPERVTAQDVMPKELVFVLDTSGSMMGFPIEKAKETMKLALDGLYPQDTFNLITFSGNTSILFPEPVPATSGNLAKAQAFLASRSGAGGTEMMKAIRAALDPSDAQDHVRIVCFMTDGYVGNDMEIISEVQKHPNARVFAFGIGGSVNRFLLDKMAEHGRGEVEYVTLSDDGSAAAKRFHERVRNPLLTDISIDWSGLPVTDIFPKRFPDLFSAKPVIVTGRYTSGARGVIKLKGKVSGRDFVRDIPIELPENESRHDVLATLWARTRIDDLMSQDYNGIQSGNPRDDIRESITQLSLNFRLMSQFTSFVAVEEVTVTDGGEPRKIEVPVEMPEGVSQEGVFVRGDQPFEKLQLLADLQRAPLARKAPASGGGGGGDRTTGVAASKGELPEISLKGGPPPASPQPRARAGRDSSKGSAGGIGRGSGAGMGGGDGRGVGPGTSSNMGGGSRVLSGGGGAPSPPSPEEQKRREFLSKVNPSIAAVIDRLKNKTDQPTTSEAKFVRNGKAEIQIWLTDKSPETIAQLKQLGFEVVLEPKSATMIVGRLPIEKLAALVELKSVRYVAPMIGN